ncbi:PIN domain-containing protein [bacterium]|nr:PIN domain-containing protein [bacterium]
MANNIAVLIDLNILLDVLQKREPFFDSSAGVLAAVESGQITGYLAAHSMIALFYLLQKGLSTADARAVIINLLQFMKIAPVGQDTIEQALNLDYSDFEDAVQMVSALHCNVNYLITRNTGDFHPALLPVLEPADFLSLI